MSSNIIFMGTPDFAIPALKEINKTLITTPRYRIFNTIYPIKLN